mmetsp:Transcript_43225/g.108300  ORF Transcript_43225/g.108300 Transcript_43225/m.108300 type:complete len:252 (+) Transcript_43225:114-869(+)
MSEFSQPVLLAPDSGAAEVDGASGVQQSENQPLIVPRVHRIGQLFPLRGLHVGTVVIVPHVDPAGGGEAVHVDVVAVAQHGQQGVHAGRHKLPVLKRPESQSEELPPEGLEDGGGRLDELVRHGVLVDDPVRRPNSPAQPAHNLLLVRRVPRVDGVQLRGGLPLPVDWRLAAEVPGNSVTKELCVRSVAGVGLIRGNLHVVDAHHKVVRVDGAAHGGVEQAAAAAHHRARPQRRPAQQVLRLGLREGTLWN